MLTDKETLIAMFSIIIGVAISLLPNFLTNKRDYHQKIANIWKIIKYEISLILNTCNEHYEEINKTKFVNIDNTKISISSISSKSFFYDYCLIITGVENSVAPNSIVAAATRDSSCKPAKVIANSIGEFSIKLKGKWTNQTSLSIEVFAEKNNFKSNTVTKTVLRNGSTAKVYGRELEVKKYNIFNEVNNFFEDLKGNNTGLSNYNNSILNKIQTFTFSPLPTYAWEVGIKDSDFISNSPDSLLKQLQEGYSSINTLNKLIESYMLYYTAAYATAETTGRLNILNSNLQKYHDDILAFERDELMSHFKDAIKEITDLELKEREKEESWNNLINLIWLIAVIVPIFTIAKNVFSL